MNKEKRFYVAMAVYAGLALLAWLTMSSVAVPVGRGAVSVRGLTWAILGFFAARTWLHWHAEKIREEREQSGTEFQG